MSHAQSADIDGRKKLKIIKVEATSEGSLPLKIFVELFEWNSNSYL